MSEIRANTVSNAAGTGPATLTGQSAAKAWVNFNGTGTIAARDSLNLSSLTDNGTGDYTVNFSNAFGAADYATAATGGDSASGTTLLQAPFNTALSTSAMQLYVFNSVFAATDRTNINGTFFGDLA